MPDALIGSTGFLGGTLLRQRPFDALYHSADIAQIEGRTFNDVICAGAPAQKWLANRHPEDDLQKIQDLMCHLEQMSCERFILISTVDVFAFPRDIDEESPINEEKLHPYGAHRRLLEKFIEAKFPNHLIVRLPGLVGPGLRKNIVYDLAHDNNLAAIDCRGVFQFYPTVNLWADLQVALNKKWKAIHLTAEPISIGEVAKEAFGITFQQELPQPIPYYDVRTRFAEHFGGSASYQYNKREQILAVRAYAQSERKTGNP